MKVSSLARLVLLSLFRITLLTYLGINAYLYFNQTNMIYPRHATGVDLSRKEAFLQARHLGLTPIFLPGHADFSGYALAQGTTGFWRGTVIVFHGNGTWAGERMNYVSALRQRKFHVVFAEYPGFGGRTGIPSEKSLVPDARELVRWVAVQSGAGPVYLWGESLGSGVAASVAADSQLPIQGLVLMTAWDALPNVGQSYYPYIPIHLLMHDHYDSVHNLQYFRHPLVLVRCLQDEIIPAALTLNLFAHLPEPKKIMVLNSTHAEWPDAPQLSWWDEAANFIAPLPGAHWSAGKQPAPAR